MLPLQFHDLDDGRELLVCDRMVFLALGIWFYIAKTSKNGLRFLKPTCLYKPTRGLGHIKESKLEEWILSLQLED